VASNRDGPEKSLKLFIELFSFECKKDIRQFIKTKNKQFIVALYNRKLSGELMVHKTSLKNQGLI